MNQNLFSFLVGSKLGDGSFNQRTPNHNVYIVFKHAVNQYNYLNWKYDFLKKFNLVKDNDIKKRKFGDERLPNWQDQYYFSTISNSEFNIFNQMTIEQLVDNLDELALSVWILDDGNLYEGECKISCGRFTIEQKIHTIKVLKNKFDIDSFYYEHPKKSNKGYIRIPKSQYQKIKKIILNSIPKNLDVVKYKLNIESVALKIKIKYFTKDITPLCFIENKSDWIDLRSAIDCTLKAGEFKLIPLGVAMELPEGYEAHVVPRSSTFKNFGIIQTNHQGVIDESYSGNNDQWFFPAFALRDTEIKRNDRICQFRIEKKMPSLEFIEVEHLENKDRGGHGSSGRS